LRPLKDRLVREKRPEECSNCGVRDRIGGEKRKDSGAVKVRKSVGKKGVTGRCPRIPKTVLLCKATIEETDGLLRRVGNRKEVERKDPELVA